MWIFQFAEANPNRLRCVLKGSFSSYVYFDCKDVGAVSYYVTYHVPNMESDSNSVSVTLEHTPNVLGNGNVNNSKPQSTVTEYKTWSIGRWWKRLEPRQFAVLDLEHLRLAYSRGDLDGLTHFGSIVWLTTRDYYIRRLVILQNSIRPLLSGDEMMR